LFAALAYQKSGHEVHIITNHHDKNRCFRETINELSVQVVASWFPRSLFGRAMAICAYIRLTLAAMYILCWGKWNPLIREPNAVFVDQIAAPLPLLRLFSGIISSDSDFKVVFYGHFPDQLLALNRSTRLARFYRAPIDWLEQWATGFAHVMLVNSKFTEQTFRQTFASLSDFPMHVVYPACNFTSLDVDGEQVETTHELAEADWSDKSTVFLSLNRFERKKNIALAIEALSELVYNHNETEVKLFIAGGYDVRVSENVEYEIELQTLAATLKVEQYVVFVRSPTDLHKVRLLRNCHVLLYTPENEHFGIVPLEGMYCGRPVVSCASGGPLETVLSGQTGFHCESTAASWAECMQKLHLDHGLAQRLGVSGRQHVLENFAFESFRKQLNRIWNL
jgi:alpha-1,3/alpha-1,6-mannosyltransferase